jgi:hypothetical protein
MDQLNKILNLNYDIQLTYEDIYGIVKYYSVLEDYFERCNYIRTIIESMNNKIIDPDTFLTIAISEVQRPQDLILIAIALRFGGNPNMYLVLKDVGIIHLMVYTVAYLRDKVDNAIIVYLLLIESLLGSSHRSLAIKTPDTGDSGFNRVLKANPKNQDMRTVGEWLIGQGFYDFSNPYEFIKQISKNDQIMIGCMVDIPAVAIPNEVEMVSEKYDDDGVRYTKTEIIDQSLPKLFDMILYNSYNVITRVPIPMTMNRGECTELKLCMRTGALEIFKELFNRGFLFTYFSMNTLIVLFKMTIQNIDGERTMVNKIKNLIYFEMIKFVIGAGIQMDKDQLNLIATFAEDNIDKINEIYNKPLWIKTCSSSERIPLPDMVLSLASSLNIDIRQDKPKICSALEETYKFDIEVLKDAAINRQKSKIGSTLQGPADFAVGNTEVMCENTGVNGSFFEYNDLSLAYYRDDSKKLWCFTVHDFENLIAKPVNPYTNKQLPNYVLNKMVSSLSILRDLDVKPSMIKPFGKSLEELHTNDKISNKESEKINTIIMNLLQNQGLYPQMVKTMSVEKFNEILSMFNMNQDYLGLLTDSHRFTTFCRALYFHFLKYPDSIAQIFAQI